MRFADPNLASVLALSVLVQKSMADAESGRLPSASGGFYTIIALISAVLLCCIIWAINRRCQSSGSSLESQARRLHFRLHLHSDSTTTPSEHEPLITPPAGN